MTESREVKAKRAIPIPIIIEAIPATKTAELEFLFHKEKIENTPE